MKKSIVTLILAVLSAGAICAQTLQVGPESLKVTGTPMSGPATAAITVWNSGTGTSYYTVSIPTASTWLAVSASSGDSTGEFDTVTATFTTTNLASGIYTSTATITQTNGTVTVKTVPIRMELDEDYNLGIASGPGSLATAASGIAIGDRTGRAVAVGANTIQIGGGVNSTAGTTAIRTWQLLDASGVILAARLPAAVTAGITSNQTFLISTGVTGTMTIVSGKITAITP